MAPLPTTSALLRPVACACFAVLGLVACADDDAVSRSERATEPTAIPAPAEVNSAGERLSLTVVDGGETTGLIITDHRGYAVYGVTGETPTGLICVDDCAAVWIPVEPREPAIATELDLELYAVIERPDGSAQVTYSNIPLYTWSGDREIGITGGAGVAGTWFALTTTGGFIDS